MAGVMMERFSTSEAAYLLRNDLGRLATAGNDGQPHVTPVTYQFDSESGSTIIPGFDVDSKKYRDLCENPCAGSVVDDVVSLEPFEARGVVVRGEVEVFEDGGEKHSAHIGGSWLRILPNRVVSWGLSEGHESKEG
jgi:pyridoxamine 5'-phosphate oxidase family protein